MMRFGYRLRAATYRWSCTIAASTIAMDAAVAGPVFPTPAPAPLLGLGLPLAAAAVAAVLVIRHFTKD